eukprot:189542-Amphidinium_carterae.1
MASPLCCTARIWVTLPDMQMSHFCRTIVNTCMAQTLRAQHPETLAIQISKDICTVCTCNSSETITATNFTVYNH